MLLPPTFIARLLPKAFKPEFIEDKNSGQKVSFPLCNFSIVVDIPEILNNFNTESTVRWALNRFQLLATACMFDARWGILLCAYTVLYICIYHHCSTYNLLTCVRGIIMVVCVVF